MSEKGDLLTESVEQKLVLLGEEIGWTEVALSVTSGSTRGDNYLGVVSAVDISGKDADGQRRKLSLFVKSIPRGEMLKDIIPLKAVYERESYMYDTILKEFADFQTEFGIENPFHSYATFVAKYLDDNNEAIVMRNKKLEGFTLFDRRKPLNYEHALFVLREYGRLHALSFALRDHKPLVFQQLAEHCKENFFNSTKSDAISQHFAHRIDKVLEAFDPVADEEIYTKLNNYKEYCHEHFMKAVSHGAAGDYAVFCHGDCWINNILFKYQNQNGAKAPSEICFLDWQLSRTGSPALDLSYFLYGCTDKKLRDEHHDTLIEEYYKSFSSLLQQFGCNANKLFPFEVLKEHLKKFSLFGLQMSFAVLFMIHTDAEDIPDFQNMTNEEDLKKMLDMFKSKRITDSHERLRGAVLDHIKFGYDF